MRYVALFVLFFATACNSPDTRHGGGGSGGGGGGGTGGSGGGGGTGIDGCSDAAKLIYTIDRDGTFSSFKPNQTDVTKSVFTDLGTLSCAAGAGYTPFSMSVDRQAVAWVEYVCQTAGGGTCGPNKLYKVSTTNATCTTTSFGGGGTGFDEFGMGFVSNTAMSTDETLYIAGTVMVGSGTSSLGTLNLTSMMISSLGSLNGDPELTGTGLGELWGFFPDDTNPRVAKIDKTTAAESNDIMLGSAAGQGAAWAFAFYGGEFWVFLAKQSGFGTSTPTTVYHVTSAGVKDTWDTQTRHIVGAGVSTCAPVVPVG
jgi:hypothetical protein